MQHHKSLYTLDLLYHLVILMLEEQLGKLTMLYLLLRIVLAVKQHSYLVLMMDLERVELSST